MFGEPASTCGSCSRCRPATLRGRAKLAELEWFLADPAKAARIYEDLLKEHETQENVSNLGWSLLLSGEYAAATREPMRGR